MDFDLLAIVTGATEEGLERQKEIIQPLIDYIRNGRREERTIRNGRQRNRSVLGEDVLGDEMYDNAAQGKKGKKETATGGLTEEVNSQGGETLFRKNDNLSPEEKERQNKLRENAKAIRRLHNVKSNYPITALRNLGFALETQEQRDEHDRLFGSSCNT
jgi:hypothetical protein